MLKSIHVKDGLRCCDNEKSVSEICTRVAGRLPNRLADGLYGQQSKAQLCGLAVGVVGVFEVADWECLRLE